MHAAELLLVGGPRGHRVLGVASERRLGCCGGGGLDGNGSPAEFHVVFGRFQPFNLLAAKLLLVGGPSGHRVLGVASERRLGCCGGGGLDWPIGGADKSRTRGVFAAHAFRRKHEVGLVGWSWDSLTVAVGGSGAPARWARFLGRSGGWFARFVGAHLFLDGRELPFRVAIAALCEGVARCTRCGGNTARWPVGAALVVSAAPFHDAEAHRPRARRALVTTCRGGLTNVARDTYI